MYRWADASGIIISLHINASTAWRMLRFGLASLKCSACTLLSTLKAGPPGGQIKSPFSAQALASTKGLFIANVEGERNISPILLGIFEHLETVFGPKVGFFQPIAGEPFAKHSSTIPRHIELLHTAFDLKDDPFSMFGTSRRECIDLLAHGKEEELLEEIYARYENYARGKQIVLVEGTHSDGPLYTPASRLELNAKLATTLGLPFIMSIDARNDSSENLKNRLMICKRKVEEQHVNVVGAILNQVRPAQRVAEVAETLGQDLESESLPLLGALPYSDVLSSTRLDEIQTALGAQLLKTHSRLDVSIDKVMLASGTLDATLNELLESSSERTLLASDQSRTDILLGLTSAHSSTAGPRVAAILVTGSTEMPHSVQNILESGTAETSHLPLLATEKTAFQASSAITQIRPDILPTSASKIEESKSLFSQFVDLEALEAATKVQVDQAITPKKFMRTINAVCKGSPQRIVLPEGAEPRILRAAAVVSHKQLAQITLLGHPNEVHAEASRISVDISQCKVEDHRTSGNLERYTQLLVDKRKHKGMTPDRAKDLLMDSNYFGTLMVASGDADGMVSGSTTTTANTIRPALQVLKTKSSLISSIFFMCLPTKVLVYGDCAVNLEPSPEELAKIGTTAADTAAAFGIEPLVAFLSYSTLGSGSGPEVEKVTKAVEIAKAMREDLMMEGPIQYDAAVDPEVARAKVKSQSQVAGKATVLIVPDLNVGNIVYKAVQQSTGAVAIGPILQGLTMPVNDLSRGCTVSDIVNTITCTAVQAAAVKGRSGREASAAA